MTLPWRPGANALRALGLPSWQPCLTRARGDDELPTAREHAWFLGVGGSGYCWECRASRPRAVFGPDWWIADIRAALEVGDLRRVRELVARGPVEDDEDFAPNRVRSVGVEVGARPQASKTPAEHTQVTDAGYPGVTGGRDPLSTDGIGGYWTRRRSDVLDVDAIDPVLSPVWSGTSTSDYDEFVGERAAIFEYLGGIPRPVAEMKARQLGGTRPRGRTA